MLPNRVAGRSTVVTAGVLVILMALALPVAALSQDVQGPVEAAEGTLVTIDATDASLDELVRMLGRAAGIRYVLSADESRPVTLNLPNVLVEDALEAVVTAAGCYYYRKGDMYIITSEPTIPTEAPDPIEPPKPVLLPVVPEGGGPEPSGGIPPAILPGSGVTRPVTPTPPPARPVIKLQMIPLSFVNAAEVAYMFGGTAVSGRAAVLNNRGGFGSMRPGSTPGMRHSGRGNRGGNGGNSVMGSFGGSGGGSRTGAFREGFGQLGGGLGGGGGGFGGGGGGFGGGGGGGLGGGLGGGGLGGGRGGGGGGFGGGGGGLSQLLPEDLEPPVAFLDDNALIVRGTAEAIDEFAEIVALLDKRVEQVEIAVKFVSITTTFEEAFGIDWAIKNTQLEIFDQGFAPPQAVNTVVRFATGNLQAQLNVLLKTSRATVINEPRVSVKNNMYASVEFTTEIPYFAAQVTFNQFGQRQVDFEPDFISVENYLDVMPRINADDSINLQLTPNISNVAGFVEGPNGETIPITTYQTVYTELAVQDGETAVLGGLIQKDDNSQKLHTPLLSKIPIIGKLFTSRDKKMTDSELLIFVTPRILREATVD